MNVFSLCSARVGGSETTPQRKRLVTSQPCLSSEPTFPALYETRHASRRKEEDRISIITTALLKKKKNENVQLLSAGKAHKQDGPELNPG